MWKWIRRGAAAVVVYGGFAQGVQYILAAAVVVGGMVAGLVAWARGLPPFEGAILVLLGIALAAVVAVVLAHSLGLVGGQGTRGGHLGLSGELVVQKTPAPGSGAPSYAQFSTNGQGRRTIPFDTTRTPVRLSIKVVVPTGPEVVFVEDDLPIRVPLRAGWLGWFGVGRLTVRRLVERGIVLDDHAKPGIGIRITVVD